MKSKHFTKISPRKNFPLVIDIKLKNAHNYLKGTKNT